MANGGIDLGEHMDEDPAFDDRNWKSDVTSIGYERGTGYDDYIQTDVEAEMFGISRSAYLRFPFELRRARRWLSFSCPCSTTTAMSSISMDRKSRRNAPSNLEWRSGATVAHADRFAVVPETETIVATHFPNLRHGSKCRGDTCVLND